MVMSLSGTGRSRRFYGVDLVLVLTTLLVAGIGIVMVYTGSRGALITSGSPPRYFLERQLLFVILGIGTAAVLACIDYRRIEIVGMVIYGLTVTALLAVLVIGRSVQGAARWFSLGPIEIQPSEFAILALIAAVATYCARRDEGLAWPDVFKLLALAAVPMLLVMKQPDLGTAIVMFVVLLVMLAVAGLPARILVILVLGAVLTIFVAAKVGLLHHYQIQRLTSFLNQDSHSAQVQKLVYNTTQSKIAISSGGAFGAGLNHGSQTSLGYVPEQQTDFIFSAVGEQLGFVGATTLLLMLSVLSWRLLRAAQMARDNFGRLLCAGLFTYVAYSVFQNAGMSMGIMPVTGIPLPFVSYGGSAAICFFAAVGVAISVYRQRSRRYA
ncbi:MAG TPA: rod shape-determining protein RodA [Acidimicrobiales bacterium]|nr:rod shape-determining protein RodA [Acidimicrobiales bacterium]